VKLKAIYLFLILVFAIASCDSETTTNNTSKTDKTANSALERIRFNDDFIWDGNWPIDSTNSEFGYGNSKYKDWFKNGVIVSVSKGELTMAATGTEYPYVRKVVYGLQPGKKYELRAEVTQVTAPADATIQIMKADNFKSSRVSAKSSTKWVEMRHEFIAASNQYYVDLIVSGQTKDGSAKFRNCTVREYSETK
jgi:hypothetical protein